MKVSYLPISTNSNDLYMHGLDKVILPLLCSNLIHVFQQKLCGRVNGIGAHCKQLHSFAKKRAKRLTRMPYIVIYFFRGISLIEIGSENHELSLTAPLYPGTKCTVFNFMRMLLAVRIGVA